MPINISGGGGGGGGVILEARNHYLGGNIYSEERESEKVKYHESIEMYRKLVKNNGRGIGTMLRRAMRAREIGVGIEEQRNGLATIEE